MLWRGSVLDFIHFVQALLEDEEVFSFLTIKVEDMVFKLFESINNLHKVLLRKEESVVFFS